ncbi:MAG: tRNA (adenosine(37)-N6)-threonylcarbamoyltransferase complex transferase subunit TsaD [Clostridiales bacterium]|nr:tRNA (adenosine(37)-N6)-threonylcarbamoyltransferase complex transferase subunit TsaD [Clostridiales bacterium]
MRKNILCLGIESSCDETSVAVIKNGRQVLSNVISSQIEIHKKFGGVVPEIASRNHIENINIVIKQALDEANVTLEDIDIIGVTYGPGLVGALLVGLSAAKGLAYALNKPLVGVHHIEGHIAANYIEHKRLKPPFVSLVISGGHTHLIHVKDYTNFEILGKTRDDAVGEAFDKVARVIGLGYPGGPKIDKLAKDGKITYNFPRSHFDNLDFSFSGVKTAVLNTVNNSKEEIIKEDICISFEQAVSDVLVQNSLKALKQTGLNKLVLAGGVAANSYIRKELENALSKNGYELYYPSNILCTDNAAMIASAAHYTYKAGFTSDIDINAIANLKIGEKDGYIRNK